jgi:aryl-alcohol dehydrogenase-like predicted oxidoreductase
MQYTNVGTSGLVVSRLGLGMMSYGDRSRRQWHLDFDTAEPIVRCAAEGGITLFDTADMYDLGASEIVTGKLLSTIFPDREDYVLATKLYYPMSASPNDRGLSRKHVFAAVDASLRRLDTEYIDLYQIHRWDYLTPIDETMDVLHDVVKSGKVRYPGASSMFAWQFATAQHAAKLAGTTPFISMQNMYNLAYREEEREMIPFCRATGVGVFPYSPLARGLLARTLRPDDAKSRRGNDDPLADQRRANEKRIGVI